MVARENKEFVYRAWLPNLLATGFPVWSMQQLPTFIDRTLRRLILYKTRQTTGARDSFQQAMQDLIDYYSNHSQSESTMTWTWTQLGQRRWFWIDEVANGTTDSDGGTWSLCWHQATCVKRLESQSRLLLPHLLACEIDWSPEEFKIVSTSSLCRLQYSWGRAMLTISSIIVNATIN